MDKLDIAECREGYYIAWFLEEDGYDEGARLGEGGFTEDSLKHSKYPEDWEAVMAELTADPLKDGRCRNTREFYWETRSGAMKALRAVRAALKVKSEKPLPSWAAEALANGWKAPKGWKP